MKLNTLSKRCLLMVLPLLLSGCYLIPFAKYSFNKEGFKKFSKKELLAGDNANPHRAYKLNKYDWALEVLPEKKSIKGIMTISFTPDAAQDTFLFDLQKRMKINSYSSSAKGADIKRKGDLLYLIFPKDQEATKRINLTIDYKGKPAIVMKEGPIQWKKDKLDRHWISTATEGIGPHFIMPCNILLGNEPDSTAIKITVPSDLIVASNGQLIGTYNQEGTRTYSYLVSNPINIYNISFNIGHFVKLVKPYKDINGTQREIECYVMDYNKETGDKYYDQAPILMEKFEEMYGVFPWWNDGCRFIESTFSAMEHQSGIAMGDDYKLEWKELYNLTLIHELSHEWWGNNITGKDYCDIWIHEGMATYSEALMLEKLFDKEDYERRIFMNVRSTYNTIPIHKKCGVIYNSWTNGQDQDIYDKGSLMMHSLRVVVNDDALFFGALKQIQMDFAQKNVSTEEMVSKLNSLLKKDYSPLLNWYLYEQKPPQLDIFVDRENSKLFYKWDKEIPFYEKGEVFIKNGDEMIELTPSTSYQSINTVKGQTLSFKIEKSIYYILNVRKEK